MNFGFELAINKHWVMTEPLCHLSVNWALTIFGLFQPINDNCLGTAINNHWVMREPLNDIWL